MRRRATTDDERKASGTRPAAHRGPQGPARERERRVRAGPAARRGRDRGRRVVAVVGKTEGNGGVNDYTRILADRAFSDVLMARGTRSLEQVKQIPIVWSGGTDGILSPHATIFATLPEGSAVPSKGHSVMRDALDPDGVWQAVRSAGLDLPERPHPCNLGGRSVTSSARSRRRSARAAAYGDCGECCPRRQGEGGGRGVEAGGDGRGAAG
jgi:hypothetical protein